MGASRRRAPLIGSLRLPTAGSTCPFPVEPSLPSAYPSKSFHVERKQGHPCAARPSLYSPVGSSPPRILRTAVQRRFLVKRAAGCLRTCLPSPGFHGDRLTGSAVPASCKLLCIS